MSLMKTNNSLRQWRSLFRRTKEDMQEEVLVQVMNLSTQNREREKKTNLAGCRTWETVRYTLNQLFIACYFNSLLQILFTIPSFVNAVMTAEVKEEPDEQESAKPGVQKEEEKKAEPQDTNEIDQQIMKRIKASKKLVIETKKLFATMLLSDKKYTDPSKVLQAIVDEYGNSISIGEQKDIGEFNSTFLARISEGLNAE
jgi:Ubiquitin carboxyl-terminal hydrolase